MPRPFAASGPPAPCACIGIVAVVLTCFVPGMGHAASAVFGPLTAAERSQSLRRLAHPTLNRVERARLIACSLGKAVPEPLHAMSQAMAPVAPTATTSLPVTGCAGWSQWLPDSIAFARWGHTMVYDPTGDRMLVFGGDDDKSTERSDVWSFSLVSANQWVKLAPTGTPPAGALEASAIFDATRNRMIVHGGINYSIGHASTETWALNLSGGTPAWQQLAPGGTPPLQREAHTAIYDGTRDRMVIFGGVSPDASTALQPVDDVWTLSLAPGGGWTQLTPTGTPPPPVSDAMAIYDAPRDRMIVYGGMYFDDATQSNLYSSGVWALSFAGTGSWTKLNPGGAHAPDLAHASANFDGPRNRMLVFGGSAGLGTTQHDINDVYALSLTGSTSWSKLSPSGVLPSPTDDHAAIYDPVRQSLMAFGGYLGGGDETWRLALTGGLAWTQLNPAGQVPRQRDSHTMVLDSKGGRLVMFGGNSANSACRLSDTWTRPLTSTGAWTRVIPATTPPQRGFHAAIWDSVGQRMLVFGGQDTDYLVSNDVWALTLGATPTWTRLAPSGTPPVPRFQTRGTYDYVHRKFIIQGGVDEAFAPLTDVWTLNLSGGGSWTQVLPTNTSALVYAAAIEYDGPRNQLVLVGGDTGNFIRAATLSLGATPAWTDGPALAGLYLGFPVCGYDRPHARVLAFGLTYTPEVYALSVSGTPAWSLVHTAVERAIYTASAASVFDPAGDRLLVHGGQNPGDSGELWAMQFDENSFSANAVSSPPEGGSVTASAPDPCQPPGTQIAFTATPASGYTFDGWSGDATGTDNPLTVTLNGNVSIVAQFMAGVVAAVIERFEVERDGDGVRVTWAFGGGMPSAAMVERAESETGPWLALAADPRAGDGNVGILDTEAGTDRAWFYRLTATLANGSRLHSAIIRIDASGLAHTGLALVTPNPARTVRIDYALAREAPVRLSVLDVSGREVAVLDAGVRGAGTHSVTFSGVAGTRSRAPGIYFVRFVTPGSSESRRIVVLR